MIIPSTPIAAPRRWRGSGPISSALVARECSSTIPGPTCTSTWAVLIHSAGGCTRPATRSGPQATNTNYSISGVHQYRPPGRWGGHLFSRVEDMLDFFRRADGEPIDAGYSAEKTLGGRDGVRAIVAFVGIAATLVCYRRLTT